MIPTELLLQRGATYKEADPGDFIFTEGDTASFYYQLTSGRVRWCNIMDNGREVLHKVAYPGDTFGTLALMDQSVYAASAIADTPCTLLRLHVSKFQAILSEFPDIQLAFQKSLASDLRFKFMLTNLLAHHSPEEVIRYLFSYFNEDGNLVCQDCNKLMLTRQQLANMTGLRVETVIRTIKQMEKDEKLSIVRGKVFVSVQGNDSAHF